MAFHIRDKETDALVRELARKEKIGIKDAVNIAVKERLKVIGAKPSLHERFTEIANDLARFPKTGKKADKKFFDELSGD